MFYDAVMFDIDGTLWNASAASAKGWNFALENLGMDRRISTAQMESVAGNTFEGCVDILLPGRRQEHPQLVHVLNQHEKTAVSKVGGHFYEGVLDGVIRLARRHSVFLVSNCQEWYLELFLAFSRLAPVLTGYDCFGKSGLSKHEMLIRMVRGCSLQHPVYIGDTVSDGKAAKRAGVDFIHAAWGFGQPEDKVKIARSFHDLLVHIAGETEKGSVEPGAQTTRRRRKHARRE